MPFHVSEGDLKGYSPPPGGSSLVPSYGYQRRDQHYQRTYRRHSATPRTTPSRTPVLHRFSGHVSVEAPGRPPAHAVCVLRSEIGHQQPLVRRIDEPGRPVLGQTRSPLA